MRNGATRGLSAPFANWNISSFPVLADAPGTGPAPSYYYLGIPKNSTRKTEAFQLISYLLSDEPQMDNSRNGLASALGKPEINSRFGESVAQLGGKNTQAFFRYSKEGTLDPEYDWDMQDFGVIIYMKEAQPLLNELLEYKRRQLEKVGVLRE
ncbi:extracellular solute-binding protein [Cohnella panacarvi]|uniref:extracellular solute-binding protein n=1 Tax=Cohnella panacarvi TaxID=400776 RepID=UPI00047EF863|nr:extracellular solute-binding protein [Cohnella panacarvi]